MSPALYGGRQKLDFELRSTWIFPSGLPRGCWGHHTSTGKAESILISMAGFFPFLFFLFLETKNSTPVYSNKNFMSNV